MDDVTKEEIEFLCFIKSYLKHNFISTAHVTIIDKYALRQLRIVQVKHTTPHGGCKLDDRERKSTTLTKTICRCVRYAIRTNDLIVDNLITPNVVHARYKLNIPLHVEHEITNDVMFIHVKMFVRVDKTT